MEVCDDGLVSMLLIYESLTFRPRWNGQHFTDNIFKCIFLNRNVWISIKISLKFVPEGPIKNIPALVQIMAWRRPGDMPLSETMRVSLPTHMCVTRPQWVNLFCGSLKYTKLILTKDVWHCRPCLSCLCIKTYYHFIFLFFFLAD